MGKQVHSRAEFIEDWVQKVYWHWGRSKAGDGTWSRPGPETLGSSIEELVGKGLGAGHRVPWYQGCWTCHLCWGRAGYRAPGMGVCGVCSLCCGDAQSRAQSTLVSGVRGTSAVPRQSRAQSPWDGGTVYAVCAGAEQGGLEGQCQFSHSPRLCVVLFKSWFQC